MTVITKDVFIASYQEQCGNIANPQIRFAMNTVGIMNILPLIETEVNAVDNFLNNLRTDNRFSIGGGGAATFNLLLGQGKRNGYNVIKDCFKNVPRHQLLGFYASTVAPFVAIWVYQRAQRLATAAGNPNNPNYRIDSAVRNAYNALGLNIMVKSAVAKRTQFFQDNIQALCLRLCNDWDDINSLFFSNPNLILKKLIKIRPTGSDFHKKGKQVLILSFKAHAPGVYVKHGVGALSKNVFTIPQRQEVRLVYKPSDVEMDWRVVGDTGAIQVQVPHLTNNLRPAATRLVNDHSLFTAINNQLAAAPIPGTPPLQLPVYKILPRYAGSNLQVANAALPAIGALPAIAANALPLEFSYGYIEFLTHSPEPPPQAANIQSIDPVLNSTPPSTWDYVTQDPNDPNGLAAAAGRFDLQNYYRIFGWYMAVGLILNFGDQHTENLIVHNRLPYLIDLEILFKHRANELAATMLDFHFRNQNPLKDKNVLLCKNGIQLTMGSQAAVHMTNGFNEAITWITNNQGIIQNWLNGTNMANVVARYTPRPTATFTGNMWSVYFANIEGQVPNPAQPNTYNISPFTRYLNWDYYDWYKFNGNTSKGRPNFALSHQNHDWACYLNCDAPAYYRRLGSLDLLNARGQVVTITNPGGLANINLTLNSNAMGNKNAELALPLNRTLLAEAILLQAITAGDAGQRISVELRDNYNNGVANQALSGVINNVGANTQIVITFATNAASANDPPTIAQLVTFINNDAQISAQISAQKLPNNAPGNTVLAAIAPTFLWARNPSLVPPGNHYFDVDIDGIPGPAQTPLQISIGRLNNITPLNRNGAIEANTDNEGLPLPAAVTLNDVITEFTNAPTAALPNPTVVNF